MAIPIPISDLTQSTLEGTGVFDVLMRSMKAHLEAEFKQGRIKGPEYATVYLGSLDTVMQTSLNFLLQRQRVALEAELMAQQVLVATAEVAKANAQVELAQVELLKANVEKDILLLNKDKIPAEIAHLEAQTTVATQQKLNLVSEELRIDAQTALTTQQVANAVIEGTVLTGQKCKLDAEYDLLLGQTLKVAGETSLLSQKTVTERAQTSAVGVDADSVIGKQKALYGAQTTGFTRDAEQKAAKLMADTWNVRRTTDEATVADGTNKLSDIHVGRAIEKLLEGVGA